ncbi:MULTISPECIES: hypothetical protein [Prochlorococcus]|uniref:hypothetical protein n=1 Tax=Prochlorococcus TaxID=1218 RepID=UPI0005338456|nr:MULTISPECIES: hypothetical protein [Prochlorococcus]KGG12844.1 hypothetical protein EV05_0516 [Prochlorococcus sp. MIT 0601]
MNASQKNTSESQAIPTDLKPEQTLGLIGLGLMQKISNSEGPNLRLVEESQEKCDLHALRQRLELIALAIQTSAPLSTSEVTYLLGARPGSEKTERGGLSARRISRNVWKLSQVNGETNYWRN